jgi:hypothetical protein
MQPTAGLKNALSMYKYLTWSYPILRKVFPGSTSTLAEVGQAMILCALNNYPKQVLEVKDIVAIAAKKM